MRNHPREEYRRRLAMVMRRILGYYAGPALGWWGIGDALFEAVVSGGGRSRGGESFFRSESSRSLDLVPEILGMVMLV